MIWRTYDVTSSTFLISVQPCTAQNVSLSTTVLARDINPITDVTEAHNKDCRSCSESHANTMGCSWELQARSTGDTQGWQWGPLHCQCRLKLKMVSPPRPATAKRAKEKRIASQNDRRVSVLQLLFWNSCSFARVDRRAVIDRTACQRRVDFKQDWI